MTNEQRWSITSEAGLRTAALDRAQRPGKRRSYEPQTKLTLSLEIDECPWCAHYEIETVDGRPTIRGIRVVPVDDTTPPPALSATDLRDLMHTDAALDTVRDGLPALGEIHLRMHGVADLHGHRPRRSADYLYAVLGYIYVDRCDAGSRSPCVDVAERLRLDCPDYRFSPKSLPNQIGEARKRELLTKAPGGTRSGGELTERGRAVLEDGPPADYNGPELPR